MASGALKEQQLKTYEADGFVVARGMFDSQEIGLLGRAAREDRELDCHSWGVGDGEGGTVRLSLWNHPGDTIYGMFARSETIVNSAEKILGDEVYHYHSKMIMKDARVGGAGIAWFEHIYSSRTLGEVRGMIRDNADDFQSNPQSTPIEVFQHNGFRDGYFKAMLTADRGRSEWKVGVESDNTFLHENTSYSITDPSRFDEGTRLNFAVRVQRPDLEQAAFVQDLMRLGKWTICAGLRWDHYQLLLNRHAVEPRFSVARYVPSSGLIVHFSYDRVFQTPSFQHILLSGSTQVESVDPGVFLRLPVQPSQGEYFEGGLAKRCATKSSWTSIIFGVSSGTSRTTIRSKTRL